jgi:hypothetical protein
VAEHPGFLLRQDDHPAGSVCEPLEHVSLLAVPHMDRPGANRSDEGVTD